MSLVYLISVPEGDLRKYAHVALPATLDDTSHKCYCDPFTAHKAEKWTNYNVAEVYLFSTTGDKVLNTPLKDAKFG